jgi:sugar phosphate isomerase/epimerase
MTHLSFMSANFVARECGYNIAEWDEGDRATQAAFAPAATFAAQFAGMLDEVVALGFDTIDIWNAHLDAAWATDDQLATARRLLDERHLRVASKAGRFGETQDVLERNCQIAVAIGAPILGGTLPFLATDRATAVATLRQYGLRLAIENHPERVPAEMLARIGDGADGTIGTAVDTGWWGTHGFDAAQAIRDLAPHVHHVHLKDVRRIGEHDTCRFGDGVVPIHACVDALATIGYRGPISIEHGAFHEDPRSDVRDSRAMLVEWLNEPAAASA